MTASEREKIRQKAKKARGKDRKKGEAKTKADVEALDLLGEDAAEAAYPGKSKKRPVTEADGLATALAKVSTAGAGEKRYRPVVLEDSDDDDS
jgi:hypothetical protein